MITVRRWWRIPGQPCSPRRLRSQTVRWRRCSAVSPPPRSWPVRAVADDPTSCLTLPTWPRRCGARLCCVIRRGGGSTGSRRCPGSGRPPTAGCVPLAVAARTQAAWLAEGARSDTAPLVTIVPVGAGGDLPRRGPLPASHLKVLDLTRVIAGPVGTRMLGALGAEVLRVDDPNRPELALHAVDGVIGKASTSLDAGTESGREALHRLVDQADVLVTGYRPGALRRLGLDPDQVADRHPGTVVVTLSAWERAGVWGARRGFDSLVQIATGIGWATSADG